MFHLVLLFCFTSRLQAFADSRHSTCAGQGPRLSLPLGHGSSKSPSTRKQFLGGEVPSHQHESCRPLCGKRVSFWKRSVPVQQADFAGAVLFRWGMREPLLGKHPCFPMYAGIPVRQGLQINVVTCSAAIGACESKEWQQAGALNESTHPVGCVLFPQMGVDQKV